MTKEELKREWLFSNALVALVGALLLGQVWEPSVGSFKLLFLVEVPSNSGFTVIVIITAITIFSIVLAVASFVPGLRCPMSRLGNGFSTPLDLLVWVAFIISWGSAVPQMPSDQWWSILLALVGLVFFFLIPIRTILRMFRSRT